MANYDVAQTLAGQFRSNILSRKQQLIVECLGKRYVQLGSAAVPPAVSQWNTSIQAAQLLAPPAKGQDWGAIQAAIWWQDAIANASATTGQSNSSILGQAAYLHGMSEFDLQVLAIYLEGRVLAVLT